MAAILGLNAYHGHAAAALVVDGELVAAAEEERFTRVKHVPSFPSHAAQRSLRHAGLTVADLDHGAASRASRANTRAHRARISARKLLRPSATARARAT